MQVTTTSESNGTELPGSDGSYELSHELDAPPWLRVESTLMATANAIRSAYDARLAPIGLTLSLASLLSYIAEFGPISQTRAAECLGQGRAVTGTQVDRLQSLGFVERRPDPDDRRVWMLAVTPGGLGQVERIADIDHVLRAELRDGISRTERQALAALLVRLQANLHQSHTTRSDTPLADTPLADTPLPHTPLPHTPLPHTPLPHTPLPHTPLQGVTS